MTKLVAVSERLRRVDGTFGGAWPLVLGFAVLALPTMATLGDQVWSRESGAHGPIILCTGAWLLWRQAPDLSARAAPGLSIITASMLVAALALYVFGRAYDFISLETAGLYGVGLSMLHGRFGVKPMLRNWFPLVYLGFAIPPPIWFLDRITAPLKAFVSNAATEVLRLVDIPVAREGVTLFVAQYQLLVEDACSGMNSLVGLIAISLFYIYLMRGSSLWYAIFLTCLVIPIAICANILRVIVLILLTYFYGDAVAQGFLHFAAGMFLFASALLMVFAVDSLVFRVRARRARPA